MPCCYLLHNVFSVHVLLLGCYQLVTTQQPFKRQALPTDHITIHSNSSNVLIADWVVVSSNESRVIFKEKFLQGKVWSDNSKLSFQPHGQIENFSAYNNVLSIFELTQMFLKANRSTDGHSYMEYRADKNVNFIFTSGVTEVNAINGQWAHISVITWQLSVPSLITIGSNILNGVNRQLYIASVSKDYSINITIFNAQMQMRYGDIIIQITSDYRCLKIIAGLYVINLKTILSPFEILISDNELTIRCENERTIVQMFPDSSNITISINNYSRVITDRGIESVILGGREIRPAGNINLLSMQLKILLESGNISSIHAFANLSQITIKTTSTNMASAAAHHVVNIIGGRINLQIFTGNISINIAANTYSESLPTMLTSFLIPEDHFQNITVNNFNEYFLTDDRNISNNKAVSTTQVPLTMVTQTVSNESRDFQAGVATANDRRIYEITSETDFIVPSITHSTLSAIKSTNTVSIESSKQSPTTVLTTSTTLSSAEKTASHPENISFMNFFTEITEAERVVTSANESSLQEIEKTTGTQIISANTSTLSTLPTSQNILSSSSFTSTTTSSTVSSSSSPTIFSTIPLIPVSALTSKQTAEIIISNVPVTSRITQSFVSTSTTSSSSNVTEVMVSKEETPVYAKNESREHVQTEFIEFSWNNDSESIIPIKAATAMITDTVYTDMGVSITPQKMQITKCIVIEPSDGQNTPLFTKEQTVMASKNAVKSIIVKTNRSIGSAWTPFASAPFEFPSDVYYSSTASVQHSNFIQEDNKTSSEISFDANEISKNEERNQNALLISSIPTVTFLKEIFDKIIQNGSPRKEDEEIRENPETKFEQQQNFFPSSKFKRALSSFQNGEIYELQLKIPYYINLTAAEMHHELLQALKKFVIFTSFYKGSLAINEDAVQIKITNMELNGEYLKVLYSVSINVKVNETSICVGNRGFNSANLLFIIIGSLIALFSAGGLLICQKQ